MRTRDIVVYASETGKEPYADWLRSLRDGEAANRIRSRVQRLARGNAGDVKPVGEGVFELRFHFGPGYRVYFGQSGDVVVILLCGGDKGSQAKDIERAKEYLSDWHEQNRSA